MATARDDDDEDAQPAQQHELDAIENGGLVSRTHGKAHAARSLRQHVRHLGKQGVEQTIRAATPQPRLDCGRRSLRTLGIEQEIHVETIATVRRNAAGRGVRLLDVAFLFQSRQDASHCGRRDTQTGSRDQ